jgi:hypothetical protein
MYNCNIKGFKMIILENAEILLNRFENYIEEIANKLF